MILFGIISTIEQIGKIFCQPALIGVFHTREKATLGFVLAGIRRYQPALTIGRQPNGDESAIARLAAAIDQTIALEGVEHTRHSGP